ncbi:hypothetical protein FBU30_004006 [Linnemannia zychae]|nr:hypothetical protein FBU30_004006 [Linnemannia zychae]
MLQGPWSENGKDLVVMTFDDPNITQEGFDIAIGYLYGVWADESEGNDVIGYQDENLQESYETTTRTQKHDQTNTEAMFSSDYQAVTPSTLTPQNVLAVLAAAAYLGIDSLCKQCTAFTTATIKTDYILRYIEFCTQSDYYPWSNTISESCHAYLVRNGFKDPKMVCLQIFEQLPLIWLIKVVGSDAFWVPSEWERYEFCRQIVHRRRALTTLIRSVSSSKTPIKLGESMNISDNIHGVIQENVIDSNDDYDEQAYDALFSSCVIYMHMSLEQLQCIQRDVDPISNRPFVRASVIQEALWHQIEFRNLIETHGPQEYSSDNNVRIDGNASDTSRKNALGVVVSSPPQENHGSCEWIQRPFSMYIPIPEQDQTIIGGEDEATLDDIWSRNRGGLDPSAAMFSVHKTNTTGYGTLTESSHSGNHDVSIASKPSFWAHILSNRQASHPREPSPSPSLPDTQQLKKQKIASYPISQNFGGAELDQGVVAGDLKQNERPGQYSLYPPFRFSPVSPVSYLSQKPRSHGGMGTNTKSFARDDPSILQGVSYHQPYQAQNQDTMHDIDRDIRYVDLPPLPPISGQLQNFQSSSNTSYATISRSKQASGNSPAEERNQETQTCHPSYEEIQRRRTAAAAGLFADSFSGYVDRRDKTKTWFKVYAISLGPDHTITQFQSAADDFAVHQSWGWRSTNLCGPTYLPDSSIPKNKLGIKLQTACHRMGLLVSPPPSSATLSCLRPSTILAEQTSRVTSRPNKRYQTDPTDSDSIQFLPSIPATLPKPVATTMVADTAMDTDYVHEYEFDEEDSPHRPPKSPNSNIDDDEDTLMENDKLPNVSETPNDFQHCCEKDDRDDGCCGSTKIFIRSPYFDFFTPPTVYDANYEKCAEIKDVNCDCVACGRYGPKHHHHPLRPTSLQISIVMGHI